MFKRSERSCKRFRHEISFSVSSYSNAVSISLSNGSQHFGDGDFEASVEIKAKDNFAKDDISTKPRGKTYKPKLDLTETVIISQLQYKKKSCSTFNKSCASRSFICWNYISG